jgi:hypothetical protein
VALSFLQSKPFFADKSKKLNRFFPLSLKTPPTPIDSDSQQKYNVGGGILQVP